jgi:hypothetical protein
MAYVYSNNKILAKDPSSDGLYSFVTDEKGTLPLTVGFEIIQGDTLLGDAGTTRVICKNVAYAIRIWEDVFGDESEQPPRYLTLNDQDRFTSTLSNDEDHVLKFTTTSTNARLGDQLRAVIGTFPIDVILQPSKNYFMVGYNDPLGLMLQSCKSCGCTDPDTGVCRDDGVCVQQAEEEASWRSWMTWYIVGFFVVLLLIAVVYYMMKSSYSKKLYSNIQINPIPVVKSSEDFSGGHRSVLGGAAIGRPMFSS